MRFDLIKVTQVIRESRYAVYQTVEQVSPGLFWSDVYTTRQRIPGTYLTRQCLLTKEFLKDTRPEHLIPELELERSNLFVKAKIISHRDVLDWFIKTQDYVMHGGHDSSYKKDIIEGDLLLVGCFPLFINDDGTCDLSVHYIQKAP
jgi:hypothetical protein